MSRRKLSFCMKLRGLDVVVEGDLSPADHSVGIMSDGIEAYEVMTEEGDLLGWDLTDEEDQAVQSAAAQSIIDDEYEADFSQREFE